MEHGTGDCWQGACERIVAHYESSLLRYATRLLNHNLHAAQDVVQEAFLRLFEKWKDKPEPSPGMSAWLFNVTHNCAVDYIRRESRRCEVQKAEIEEAIVWEDDAEAARCQADVEELAREALSVLDLRERQMVILKVYENKSYREISAISGLRIGHVGYILHHAMRKMSQALKRKKS